MSAWAALPTPGRRTPPRRRWRIRLIREVMQRRAEVLMTEQLSIAEEINKTFVGKTFTVMVEDMDEESGLYYGRSYMDAPDIDTKVYFSSEEDLCPGDFVEVVIENFVEYDLVGHIKE